MASPVKFSGKGATIGASSFKGGAAPKTRAAPTGGIQARMRRNKRTGEMYQSGEGGGDAGRTAHYNKSHVPD